MNKLIRAELERINTKYGGLEDEIILREARNPKNPMHGKFTWNKDEAAHKYNLREARDLIYQYKLVVTVEEYKIILKSPKYGEVKGSALIQGFLREKGTYGKKGRYTSIQRHMNKPVSERKETLQYYIMRIEDAVEAIRTMALCFGLEDYVNDILKSLTSLSKKVELAKQKKQKKK
jgi:hypothetical protein